MMSGVHSCATEGGWWPVCCQWAGRRCHHDQGVVGIQGNQSTQGRGPGYDNPLIRTWLEELQAICSSVSMLKTSKTKFVLTIEGILVFLAVLIKLDIKSRVVLVIYWLWVDNIFNVVIWYRESFISLGECVISCNCYLIWRILYPRKGKCDQWQDCYQLKHPPLIWRILLSDPHFKPFNLDLYNIYSLFDMVDLWNIFIPWE